MKNLNQINICYLPYDLSLKAPGDRRRFIHYAKFKKIQYKTKIRNHNYELIYVTYGQNFSKIFEFIKDNPKTKIIFEMVDANLSEGKWSSFQKGIGRFLLGKESKVYLDYKKPLKQLIKKSDAIVCGSKSQLKELKKYNKKIFITLDFLDDEVRFKKRNWLFDKKKIIRLFWEGMIYNLKHLIMLNDIIKCLDFRVHVVIVTELKKSTLLNMSGFNIDRIVKKFQFSFEIHDWNKVEISKIATSCDIGIIPINLSNLKARSKPDNKLIFMWKTGLPVVASATPAYKEVMKLAKIKMYAKNFKDWINILNNFHKSSSNKHHDYKQRVDRIIKKNYSKAKLVNNWSKVFRSVGCKV